MRIVVKVGSSSITTPTGHIDPDRIGTVVDAVIAARARGDEVVLVSSGAIAAGLGPLGLPSRPRDLATQQAAAAVGQRALIAFYSEAFAAAGLTVGQVLLTIDDVTRRSHYRNAYQTFAKLLELGVVPIVNENDTVATSEIRFGDNDRLAALVAHLVHADRLVLLSDVDALYTGHPSLPDSRPIRVVASASDLVGVDVTRIGSAVGTGGMRTKIDAARIATAAGIPVRLTSAEYALAAVADVPDTGTLFEATGKRRPTRLLWLAHASETQGRVLIDAGAVTALVERGASLLAVGVTGVEGEFSSGEPVDVVGPDGVIVARGMARVDSADVPALLGKSGEGEIVHRDDLVLL